MEILLLIGVFLLGLVLGIVLGYYGLKYVQNRMLKKVFAEMQMKAQDPNGLLEMLSSMSKTAPK